jgi:small-conductance mechanosensitive channel
VVVELQQLLDILRGYVDEALVAIAVAAVTVFAAAAARQSMRRALKPRLPLHVYKILENAVFYGVLGLGVMVVLGLFGVDLTGLLVAGGFAGLVVGLASQQAVSNLVSGLFLLIEQPLRPGDPVSVGGVSGTVIDINVLSTRIRTWDGYVVRMPNSKVFESEITNYQRTKARRVEFEVGVSYRSSIEKAVEALRRMVEDHPFCLVNPEPQIFVDRYDDSAIVLKVRCWTPPQVWFQTRAELQTMVKKVLDEAGVEIPFPQLDLHVKDSVPLKLVLETGQLTKRYTCGSGEGAEGR